MEFIKVDETNLDREHICCANRLLELCMEDVRDKGAIGLTVISSEKKMPFLSDPKYLKYKGFQTADRAEPHFELLYLNSPISVLIRTNMPRCLKMQPTGGASHLSL